MLYGYCCQGCCCDTDTVCVIIRPIIVYATPGTIQASTETTCVHVTATGGTPPYTGIGDIWKWRGSHTFTVTDAMDVQEQYNTIGQPTKVTGSTSSLPASCGLSNGSATSNSSGVLRVILICGNCFLPGNGKQQPDFTWKIILSLLLIRTEYRNCQHNSWLNRR